MHETIAVPPQVTLPCGLRLARRFPLPHKLGLLDRLFGAKLQRLGIVWARTWNGKLWKLDLREIGHRWMVYGVYEGRSWLDWLRPRLANGGVVIESGANIGQTLMYYAGLPGIKVFAFEPNPLAADWLQECLMANPGLETEVIRYGLAAESGEVNLQLADARSTMIDAWYRAKEYERLCVPVIGLDEFANCQGIKRVVFWKLDVEGFEIEALTGADS